MTDTIDIPPDLVHALTTGRCIAFVGAGFSAAAQLPTWTELLRALAQEDGVPPDVRQYVDAALQAGTGHRHEEAAQILYYALGRRAFVQALHRRLAGRPLTPPMQQRLALLGGIPFRFILTTNFDDVLAGHRATPETFARVLRGGEDVADGFSIPGFPPLDLHRDPRHVIKLHGDLAHPDSVVFSRLDYRERLYRDASYLGFLRAVFLHHTVLYLGFSFTDTYLNELRSEVLAMLGPGTPEPPLAYAVMNDVPAVAREHLRKTEGIEVIGFDSRGFRDFSGFDRILASLHDATSPVARFGRLLRGRRILWLDPRPESVDAYARDFFDRAGAVNGETSHVVAFAGTPAEALAQLRAEPFDLVITHWGHGLGEAEDESAAVSLLRGVRRDDVRVPVVVFASGAHIESNKPAALRLGAQGYFYSWRALTEAIRRVFDPGLETG